jgi:aspartate-semialdehyde dehydrogenase
MKIKKLGMVGWRGMVGSVLMDRMRVEKDFEGLEPRFYSTSQVGMPAPDVGRDCGKLDDAKSIDALKINDVIISCQGGDYTREVLGPLRKAGWKGFWIDAASARRMDDDALIALDPINREAIDSGIKNGILDFIGGNCTVSLMLLSLHGLFREGWVEWLSSMTYQAASGAGAKQLKELVSQMSHLASSSIDTYNQDLLRDPSSSVLHIDRAVTEAIRSNNHPTSMIGAPLAASLIPWIDRKVEGGQTREEWKGHSETNKILDTKNNAIPIDGICVRIGAMRCHSQAFTIKLRKDIPLDEIVEVIDQANQWVTAVDNNKEDTIRQLSPAATTGTLNIPIGRIHKLKMGPTYLGAFSVGDQLLWGAAEPLRRMLNILREHAG